MVQLNYIKEVHFIPQIVPISHLKTTSEISEIVSFYKRTNLYYEKWVW